MNLVLIPHLGIMGAALVGGVVFGVAPEPSWTWFGIKLLLVLAYAMLVAVLYRVWRLVR